MPHPDSGGIFSRDLKYLVDPGHTVGARRPPPRPRLFAAATAAFAVVAGIAAANIGSEGEEPATPFVADVAPSDYASHRAPQQGDDPSTMVFDIDESLGDGDVDTMPAQPQLAWTQHNISRGDNLTGIFAKYDVPIRVALELARHDGLRELSRLRAGRELRLGFHDGQLRELAYDLGDHIWLHASLGDDRIDVEQMAADLTRIERRTGGVIKTSLFHAGSKAGLSDRMVMELAAIFGWDIDFALDLRAGDEFRVIYEELYDDGKRVGTGDILAAEFVNRGRRYQAFRYVHEDDRVEYYDANGGSMRGTFLRTPVKFSRITSGFTHKRYHPVLKKWRAHKGVDYGAPRGTPVLATADGKVDYMGRKGGYGKTVVLRHGGKFSTLYAHLSSYKRGLKPGAKVQQGQLIGFVGSTGLATGPHLHYEFRVNGVHRDPLSYDMPKSGRLAGELQPQFLAQARRWIEQLANAGSAEIALTD